MIGAKRLGIWRMKESKVKPKIEDKAKSKRASRELRPGQVWVRQTVMPGVELHVLGAENALTERQLAALVNFISDLEGEGGEDGS